jgi:hypothetical protein
MCACWRLLRPNASEWASPPDQHVDLASAEPRRWQGFPQADEALGTPATFVGLILRRWQAGASTCQRTKTMMSAGERLQPKHEPQQLNSPTQKPSGRCCLLQPPMTGLRAMPQHGIMAKNDFSVLI